MNRSKETGNVLFYILIAIALLAALSYAIAQSTRGNVQQLSADKARLIATELIEYGNIVANATGQLRLRGVAETDLCFDAPGWPGGIDYTHAGCADDFNKLYHSQGGGVIWKEAPPEAMDNAAAPDFLWHYYSDNEIQNIGSTCGAAACSDLILVVDELSEIVCIQINNLLGIGIEGDPPPTDAGLDTTLSQGAFGYANTIGDEVGGVQLAGQSAGCFQKTGAGSRYAYYKVLLAR